MVSLWVVVAGIACNGSRVCGEEFVVKDAWDTDFVVFWNLCKAALLLLLRELIESARVKELSGSLTWSPDLPECFAI